MEGFFRFNQSMTVEEFLRGINVKVRDNDDNIRQLLGLRCNFKCGRSKTGFINWELRRVSKCGRSMVGSFTIFESENGLVDVADLQMPLEDFLIRQIKKTSARHVACNRRSLTVELVDGSYSLMAVVLDGEIKLDEMVEFKPT